MTYLAPLSLIALIFVAGCDMSNMSSMPKDTDAQMINDEPGSADDEAEATPES